MTVAVCVKCGSIKHGAFNGCKVCGLRPETEIDLAYSLALTDHYFSEGVLRQISSDMKQGGPRPSLPSEQETQMREAARDHIEKFGEMLGLPPPSDAGIRRRSAKFRGWDKDVIRKAPVSRLMWRAGFGWIAVSLLLVPSIAATIVGGALRITAVGLALLSLLFNGYRWQRWNKQGWPQLHRRAMLLYAQIAGFEAARAEREKREFSKVDACHRLAFLMVGGNWRDASVEAMISGLVIDKGDYFAEILKKFGARAAPHFDGETIDVMAALLRRVEFGPQLVIGNIIENTFGGEEAARYAIALMSEKAQ